jgi:hypothetical protein
MNFLFFTAIKAATSVTAIIELITAFMAAKM